MENKAENKLFIQISEILPLKTIIEILKDVLIDV